MRANDTDYRFRAETAHTYLCGNQTSDAVLVIEGGEAVLYARPRSSRETDEFFRDRQYGELWAGRRPSLQGDLGLAGHRDPPPRRARRPTERARRKTRVLRGVDARVDALVAGDAGRDADFARVLSELRLVKDEWELSELQSACDITTLGFEDSVREWDRVLEHGERWVEGTFFRRARTMGNDIGYDSIVGGGRARHHAALDRELRSDHSRGAGAARHGRRGDLALHRRRDPHAARRRHASRRCSATSTHWSSTAQQAGIDAVRPGAAFRAPHEAAMAVLAHGLDDLGAAAGLRRGGALPRQPGLRAVDAARHQPHARPRRARLRGSRHGIYPGGELEEGMVLTVEPGLYFQEDDLLVPEELRGIGIRIEDDVVVTADGCATSPRRCPAIPTRSSRGWRRCAAEARTWAGAMSGVAGGHMRHRRKVHEQPAERAGCSTGPAS